MEPRHQDFAAEEVARDRQAEPAEMDQSGANVVDDLNPDGDDTGYDEEIEDEG
jgi:hypothetical protein